jgi:hypothetical protein
MQPDLRVVTNQNFQEPVLLDSIRAALRIIRDETEALRRNEKVDHVERRMRKDLCLLDLMRRSRQLGGRDPGPETRAEIQALREAIIENQQVLRLHLAAARHLSDLILRAMVEEESDRTYSDRVWLNRAK